MASASHNLRPSRFAPIEKPITSRATKVVSRVALTGNATYTTAPKEATTTIANGATVRRITDPVQIAATMEIQGWGRSWYVAWSIAAATARDPPSSTSSTGSLGSM